MKNTENKHIVVILAMLVSAIIMIALASPLETSSQGLIAITGGILFYAGTLYTIVRMYSLIEMGKIENTNIS